MKNNAVGSAEIINNSIQAQDIDTDAVTADELADNAVDTDAIQNDAVTSAKIENKTIQTEDIADGAIKGGLGGVIHDESITEHDLAAGSVGTSELQNESVTFDKLAPEVRDEFETLSDGVAIALALQNPDLTGIESFGISVNAGFYEDSTALGIAAMGVLSRDLFGGGERLAISGGVGFGSEGDNVGGRVGAQITW
jgi:hypothetical protein